MAAVGASVLCRFIQLQQQQTQQQREHSSIHILCTPLGGRPSRKRVMSFLGHLLRQDYAAQTTLPAHHIAPSLLRDRLLVCFHRANDSPQLPANCTTTKKTVREDWRVTHTVYTTAPHVYAYRYDVITEPILPGDTQAPRATLIRCWEKKDLASSSGGGGTQKRRVPQSSSQSLSTPDRGSETATAQKRLRVLEERVRKLEESSVPLLELVSADVASSTKTALVSTMLADMRGMLGSESDEELT